MINLIPNEYKKKMYRDVYLRFIALFFIMLGVSFLVASIAILPAFFVSSSEKNLLNTELQDNESITSSDQDAQAIIKDLDKKLNLIENDKKNKIVFSQKVVNEIVLKKIPGIKITEIFYQNDSKTGAKIGVKGRAGSRDVLLLFRKTLEDNMAFSKVDLPISNFVKDSNIEFNLNLIPS